MRLNEASTGAASRPKTAPAPSPAQRISAAAGDMFDSVVRDTARAYAAPHQTTAGEVSGQGQYPGVPGSSALDNWMRSQAIGTYSAPDYARQLFEKAGYAEPSEPSTGRQSLKGLDLKAAKELLPYGYRVTPEEAESLLATYMPEKTGDPAKLTQEKVESANRSVPMTLEAYNKLSDDQRAAVDFNTALVAAREKDLASGWMIRVAPSDKYSKDQKAMFGEDATTGGYAPETTALLEKIKYSAPGSSLTDFLSLDAAISADQLDDLNIPTKTPFLTSARPDTQKPAARDQIDWGDGQTADAVNWNQNYGQARSAENLAMIQLDTIRRAQEIIKNFKGTPSWSPAGTATRTFGIGNPDTPWGWGYGKDRATKEEAGKDEAFRTIFDTLLNDRSKTKVAESEGFWNLLKQNGFEEKDIDELFQFIDQRTRWMLQNKVPNYSKQNDATVIRELAGLGPADVSAS